MSWKQDGKHKHRQALHHEAAFADRTARPTMAPLAPLEAGGPRRDGDSHLDRNASLVSASHSSSNAPNHAAHQPQGYVSPYSQGSLSLTHLANAASKEFGTPPDSRRASGEEKDLIAKQNTKQSLPSISEALGIDNNNASYPPMGPSGSQAAVQPGKTTPPMSTMRNYAAEPVQPHAEPYASKYGPPYAQHSSPAPYAIPDPTRSALSGLRPALHVHTPQVSAYASSHPRPNSNASPATERPPQTSTSSAAPTTFPYGYTSYPPRYAQSASTTSSVPAYHAGGRAGWETESHSGPQYNSGEKTYGESVKRHLDLYDLESALNDVSAAKFPLFNRQ